MSVNIVSTVHLINKQQQRNKTVYYSTNHTARVTFQLIWFMISAYWIVRQSNKYSMSPIIANKMVRMIRFSDWFAVSWRLKVHHPMWVVCLSLAWIFPQWLILHTTTIQVVSQGILFHSHGPLTRYVKSRVAQAPGMPGTFSHHRGLVIPTWITARAWCTCRDACRDR